MPIVDILRRNAAQYGDDDALVELNYDAEARKKESELELVQSAHRFRFRNVLTWKQFDDISNRFANYLMVLGIVETCAIFALVFSIMILPETAQTVQAVAPAVAK